VGIGVPEKGEGRQGTGMKVGRRAKSALVSNTKRGKTKAGGGNARNRIVVLRLRAPAISDQTGFRIRLFPEIEKVRALHFIEKALIRGS
jgi:hypothetical protein